MDLSRLLRLLYRLEEPILQANAWSSLRTPVSGLLAAAVPSSEDEVFDALLQLRREGQVMLLPDWERWGLDEDVDDGAVVDSLAQWEPQGDPGADPTTQSPSWQRRKVFLPGRDHLKHWSVRSRIAETIRLLGSNRERFGLEPATAHLGYKMQERKRPARNVPLPDVVARLTDRVAAGAFPGAVRQDLLREAIAIAGAGLLPAPGRSCAMLAAFQERSWEAVLCSLFGGPGRPPVTMQTAGVSSGKTFGFLLPALTLLVYRALSDEGGVIRVLVVYPRTSLVEDQYNEFRGLLDRVNIELNRRYPGRTLTARPGLDAGNLLNRSIEATGSLADVLPEVARRRIEIILTTPESLKNRMLDPRAMHIYLHAAELVVFDEVHLLEGLAGCQQVYFIRRLGELMRQLRGQPDFAPAWVGASATVAQPVQHAARVFSIGEADRARIADIRPHPEELEWFATFHHVFVHTRVGKPSLSAVTNGLACLTHTRNDGTAHTHYLDPSATPLVRTPSDTMPKTIVFVDSLSTIGRLDFTTRDNERCWGAEQETPYPYYTWFYRPAARLRAITGERKTIKSLPVIREWCQKCIHGIPARIDAAALKELPPYLRTGERMDQKAQGRATPLELARLLADGTGQVGNLDECPFHKARVCWWFSQDRGDRRLFGQVPIYIDQNRTVVYTSHTGGEPGTLKANVNDFFRRSPGGPEGLWFVRDDDLRPTLPRELQPASTMLASPRIEVGVDFSEVRDGLTHKAIRSAASFQQKVGRVGRELDSDSLIVTFLAHRSVDSHFAHHPDRLINSQHLDPIPLASENPDVLATHLFTAALEYIGSRPSGVIPGHGEQLEIIGTGSPNRVPDPWDAKVRGCLQYLRQNRTSVRDCVLRATRQRPDDAEAVRQANAALDCLIKVLGLFVVDLTPMFIDGHTPAHWFKENQQPNEIPAFGQLMTQRQQALAALEQPANLPAAVAAAADRLRDVLRAKRPADITPAAAAFHAALVQHVAGINPALLGTLFAASGFAQAVAVGLAALPPGADLDDLLRAREIMLAFCRLDRDQRVQQQYYLHDVLTRLLPFRDFYPYGLLRTHFQPIQAREVRIRLPGRQGIHDEDTEGLDSVLYELLPGTWNYRWGRALKSPCERVEQSPSGGWYVNLSRIGALAEFRETGTSFTASELPADIPTVSGATVPMLRPSQLTMIGSAYQPFVRRDDGLIGDNDEASPPDPASDPPRCSSVPRAFPAVWYRVEVPALSTPAGAAPVPRPALPALGRVVLGAATFHEGMQVDRYVYAIDRTYGNEVPPPRIHYRRGTDNPLPVVLGDTLLRTDGLTFRLRPDTVNAVLDEALGGPGPLRGEVTLRALRRFIVRTAGCDPFRSDLLRKVLVAHHLSTGGTLDGLDAAAVRRTLSAVNPTRYDTLASALLDGVFADDARGEMAASRRRQASWYEKAWDSLARVRDASGEFDDAFVREMGRDLLVHSLAVGALDAAGQLVGAAEGDLGYFYRGDRHEVYLFDSVDGGNGYAETVDRFLHIPPQWRTPGGIEGTTAADLPSSDWIGLFEEVLSACPAQTAARLLFEACRAGVQSVEQMTFPPGVLPRDLEARLRLEFDPIIGAAGVVAGTLAAWPALFRGWQDLLWLQVVPEYFAQTLLQAGAVTNLSSLVARTHLCTTGCLECVNNGDGSVHGALLVGEHVSRNLLDALVRYVRRSESGDYQIVPAGADRDSALQARGGRPVLVTSAPDAATGPLLVPGAGVWEVQLPSVAAYRDETIPAP